MNDNSKNDENNNDINKKMAQDTTQQKPTQESINLKQLLKNAILDKKIILFSIIPLFTSYWLQDVVFSKSFGTFIATIPTFVESMSTKSVIKLLLPYLVSHTLFYINDMIIANSFPVVELRVIKEITDKTIESIKQSKIPINTNEFIMNLKKILDIKNVYFLMVSYIIPTIFGAFALLYYFSACGKKPTIFLFTVMFIFLFITTKLELDCINKAHDNQGSLNDLYDHINDIMLNLDTVITSNSKQKELDELKEFENTSRKKYICSENNANNTAFKLRMISLGFTIMVEAIAIYMYKQKVINTSTLMTISLLALMFMEYYNSAIYKVKNMLQHIGKFTEIDKYFATFPTPILEPFPLTSTHKPVRSHALALAPTLTLTPTKGTITFQNINLKRDDKIVFKNFNLKIDGGTKVGIKGEIGCGKTTLLKMVANLVPYNGTIYIDNQPINRCTHESLCKNIVYIPQHPKLFNKTIMYNLNYGSNYTEAQIWNKIKTLNLTSFFDSFPQKLQTPVGKEGSKLSGGQRQFLALIRALIQDKKIILLDEPTSSLDSKVKELFIELIEDVKDKTIVMTTHDDQILFLFDRVIKI